MFWDGQLPIAAMTGVQQPGARAFSHLIGTGIRSDPSLISLGGLAKGPKGTQRDQTAC
jgi:hypothetical protein